MTYPCNYCGSCSIWLSAYEPGSGIYTEEQLIEACKKYYNCPLPGLEVPKKEENKNA